MKLLTMTILFLGLCSTMMITRGDDAANKAWKDSYFKEHPEADMDKNGALSWWELNQHKNKKIMPETKEKKDTDTKEKTDAEIWKDSYFKKFPAADTNGNGVLSWPEYKAHKKPAGK